MIFNPVRYGGGGNATKKTVKISRTSGESATVYYGIAGELREEEITGADASLKMEVGSVAVVECSKNMNTATVDGGTVIANAYYQTKTGFITETTYYLIFSVDA